MSARPTIDAVAPRRSPRARDAPAPDSPRTAGAKRVAALAALSAAGGSVGPKSPRARGSPRDGSPTGFAGGGGPPTGFAGGGGGAPAAHDYSELQDAVYAIADEALGAAAANFGVSARALASALAAEGDAGAEARACELLRAGAAAAYTAATAGASATVEANFGGIGWASHAPTATGAAKARRDARDRVWHGPPYAIGAHFSPWALNNRERFPEWASGHSAPLFAEIAGAFALGVLNESAALDTLEAAWSTGVFFNLLPFVDKREQPDGGSSAPRGPFRDAAAASTSAALRVVLREGLLRAVFLFGAPATKSALADAEAAFGAKPFVLAPWLLRIASALSREGGGEDVESVAPFIGAMALSGAYIFAGGKGAALRAALLAATNHVTSVDHAPVYLALTSPMAGTATAAQRHAVARRTSTRLGLLLAGAAAVILARAAEVESFPFGRFFDALVAPVADATRLGLRWMAPHLRALYLGYTAAAARAADAEELLAEEVHTRASYAKHAARVASVRAEVATAQAAYDAHAVGGSHALQRQLAAVLVAEAKVGAVAARKAAALRAAYEAAREEQHAKGAVAKGVGSAAAALKPAADAAAAALASAQEAAAGATSRGARALLRPAAAAAAAAGGAFDAARAPILARKALGSDAAAALADQSTGALLAASSAGFSALGASPRLRPLGVARRFSARSRERAH